MAKFRFSLDNGQSWVIVDDALPKTIAALPNQEVLVQPIGSTITVVANLNDVVSGAFGELFASYFKSLNNGVIPEALRSDATEAQKKKLFFEIPIPPRINPVEAGVSLDVFGDSIFPPMTSTDNDRTLDDELDWRLEGFHPTDPARHAVAGGVFYSNYTKFTGGRRVLLRRWDTKGFAVTVSRPVDWTSEGIRGDYFITADADGLLHNGQPDILKPKPIFRVGNAALFNLHGNNADGYLRLNSPNYMPTPGDPSSGKAKTGIVSIEHGTDGFSKITLAAAFADKLSSTGTALVPARNVHGSVPGLPDFFLVHGTSTGAQGVRTLQDANWRYDILSAYTNSGLGSDDGTGTITVTGTYNAPIFTLGGTYLAGNKIDLFIADVRFSYTVQSGSTSLGAIASALRALIVGDARFSGSTVASNVIAVVSSGLPTSVIFWGKPVSGNNIVQGTTATGGTAVWHTQYLVPGNTASSNRTLGTHADPLQWAQATGNSAPIYQQYVMIDRCTLEGNYDGLVFANSASSDCPLQMTRTNYRWKSYAPDEVSSGSFRLGYTGGVGLIEKRLFDVWVEPRALDGAGQGIGVTASGKDANGIPDGTTVMSGSQEIGYASARPEIKGVIKRGLPPGGDFATFANNGPDYVHPGYSDINEFAGAISDITFTGVTDISETLAAGSSIGLFDVVTTNKAGDIDLSVVSTNVSARNWFLHGRRLVNGVTRFDNASAPLVLGTRTATLTIRATIRGSSPVVSYDKTFSWPVLNDVAPAGSPITVTNVSDYINAAPGSSTVVPVAIGAASVGRYVLFLTSALIASVNRELPTTLVVAGATGGTARRILRKRTPLTSNPTANIALEGAYIARIDAGTTADLTMTVGGSYSALGIGAVALSNLNSDSPFSVASADNGVSGGSVNMILDIPANGVAVLSAYYSTPTSGNKRHSAAVFSRAVAGSYAVRATVTAGSAGPLVWEIETSPGVWAIVDNTLPGYINKYDTFIESGGSGGTSAVALSFGNGYSG